jgi:hypothetical protein
VQYGLIAEEVAKVYPNLVQYDKAGKPFTVYYHLLTPMLLNELQREHRQAAAQNDKIEAQQHEIATLKSELAAIRQVQMEQNKVLVKLSELVETAQKRVPSQQAGLTQR